MYHEDARRFRAALTLAEAVNGFSSRLLEKDYYCSVLLHDLAVLFAGELVFKGGTCLSKVHAEFFRLSEDLDFAVPVSIDAAPADRRRAIAPFKDHFAAIPDRLECFRLLAVLQGHDSSRQYIGQIAYRSIVTGEDESIKLEISLREPIVLATEVRPAWTMLLDPDSNEPVFPAVEVRVLSLREAYAEKFRAALTRRAIRDYFDIDNAVGRGLFDYQDPQFLYLVSQKLAIARNDPVDTSTAKMAALERQIEAQLRPVLRARDFDTFNLQRVAAILLEIVSLCPRG
jgi:predicted nucleotidyltransferase component of viral defense system